MSERVSPSFTLHRCTTSPPPSKPSAVVKTVKTILQEHPTSPPPPPPLEFSVKSSEDNFLYFQLDRQNGKVVPFLLPKKTPSVALDIARVKDWVRRAELEKKQNHLNEAFGYYSEAIYLLNFSDPRGLLLSAFCYLKVVKLLNDNNKDYYHYVKQALTSLQNLEEQLWGADSKEKEDCTFMYLLGGAYLALGWYSKEYDYLRKAKNAFLKAHELLQALPQHPLKYEIILGVGLSFFYLVRCEIALTGTKKKEQLLKNLQSSRTYLEKTLLLRMNDAIKYVLSLNHAMTGFLIMDQQAREIRLDSIVALYDESKEHWVEALMNLPPNNGQRIALRGCLQYKIAFDDVVMDYEIGCEAFETLSFAVNLNSNDPPLAILHADAARQLAWAYPMDIFQSRAEHLLNKAAEVCMGQDKLFSDSCLLVFNIQRALWQILQSNEKIAEQLKPENPNKSDLGDLRKNLQADPNHLKKVWDLIKKEITKSRLDRNAVEVLKKKALGDLNTLEKLRKKSLDPKIFEDLKEHILEDLKEARDQRKFALETFKQVDGFKRNAFRDLKHLEGLKRQAEDDLEILDILRNSALSDPITFENLQKNIYQDLEALEVLHTDAWAALKKLVREDPHYLRKIWAARRRAVEESKNLNENTLDALREKTLGDLNTLMMVREHVPEFESLKKEALDDLKKIEVFRTIAPHLLKRKALDTLEKSLDGLRTILRRPPQDTYFELVWPILNRNVLAIENNLLRFTIVENNPVERGKTHQLALSLGTKLGESFIQTLFHYNLMERLLKYELILDLDLDLV